MPHGACRSCTKEAAKLTGTLPERIGPGLSCERVRGDELYLLAIKRHRQLSFDFPEHWQD